jgi:fibrillarin-like rRNA methylase
MRRIDAKFVQKGGKLIMLIDPSQISSTAHAEEILRDLIAQWVRERRVRGLVNYEPLPNPED